MKKYILPLAAGFALGLSGAAMAGNVGSDHGKVAAQDHSIVATVSGPQLLTDSQMDNVVAGGPQGTYIPGGRSGNGLANNTPTTPFGSAGGGGGCGQVHFDSLPTPSGAGFTHGSC